MTETLPGGPVIARSAGYQVDENDQVVMTHIIVWRGPPEPVDEGVIVVQWPSVERAT